MLPVAQVGGEVVGARLLIFRGMKPAIAGASVIVDLTLEAATQLLFTLIGLALLAAIGGGHALIPWIALGSLVGALGLVVFVLAQRYGLLGWIERKLAGLASNWRGLSSGQLIGLQDYLRYIYRRRTAVAGVCHLLGWIAGSDEIWLAFYFMGQPISLTDAVMLESEITIADAVDAAAVQ